MIAKSRKRKQRQQHSSRSYISDRHRHAPDDVQRSPSPDPALFIQAYEADVVRGPQAEPAAASLEVEQYNEGGKVRFRVGDGLIKWKGAGGSHSPDGLEPFGLGEERIQLGRADVKVKEAAEEEGGVWVDRYDARLLLDALPSVGSQEAMSINGLSSPGGWSDLPSDTEDTFFLNIEEVEDYRREKRRKLIDQGREERLRALRAEAGEDQKEDTAEEWGDSDEEPDDEQKELMRRTATHILASPNPAQLEMRILANHGADTRFAFLRGRWSQAWKMVKGRVGLGIRMTEEAEKEAQPAGGGLGGLAGYGDSDDDSSNDGDEKTGGPSEKTRTATEDTGPDMDDELKKARRARAKEWAEKRRAMRLRQYPLYSKTKPPPALAGHFTDEVFAKSQAYGKAKAKFSLVAGLYKQTLDSLLLHFGVYAWAWKAGGQLTGYFGYGPEYEILQSITFAFVLFFVSSIPSIPLSVYQTFVLEEKHGFNKTTPGLFIADLLKGWAIGLVIAPPFLSAFLYVFKWAGDRFVPWLMAFLLAFQLIMVVIFPTVIQPLFNKLSPLAEGELRTRIESLASKLKFPLKHLYEIDGSKRSSHSNAYFYGLPWSKHIVIFDTLIKQSKPDEVEAVLAHELGHWYYLHPSKLLLVSQLHLFSILALFPAFLHAPLVLRAFDFPVDVSTSPPTIVAFLLFQMIISPVEAVVSIGMNAVSRRFEYQADHFACELQHMLKTESMADMGDRLGRALVTLHVENLSTVWVDWLYSAYHHSHPTLTERLRALEGYKASSASAAKKEL
ncbi:uncharacterized protein FIBRA_00886 [Fibroporia radiculosa]|uniref:Ste24 endopeptidase n=1 Tax=Fibroporia radiculosa TaxID=599839 RepID=J4H0S9_9APHY|nr:uncharacterized protein FIBRA_00886 [Fibroporia radiculosa]CCL98879.1 predicted protein [Fibroporia radiculosa]